MKQFAERRKLGSGDASTYRFDEGREDWAGVPEEALAECDRGGGGHAGLLDRDNLEGGGGGVR